MKMTWWMLGATLAMPLIAQAAPVAGVLPAPSMLQNRAQTRVPFSASSMSSEFFALVGQMSGHCLLQDGQLKVYLNRGQIFYRDRSSYRGPRPLVSLSVKLVTSNGGGGKWKPVAHSNEIPLNATIRVGESIPVNDMDFTISPGNEQIDLTKCWLAFQITTKSTEGGPAFSYIHSDHKVFAPYVENGD